MAEWENCCGDVLSIFSSVGSDRYLEMIVMVLRRKWLVCFKLMCARTFQTIMWVNGWLEWYNLTN